jgi:hypothetical protein
MGGQGVTGGQQRKKELAIAALLSCRTIADAARSCGLSERTLKRWLRDEEFSRQYRQAKSETLAAAMGKLAANAGEAVEALLAVIRNRRASAAARVSASVRLIELCLRDRVDSELEGRLRELELELARREDG